MPESSPPPESKPSSPGPRAFKPLTPEQAKQVMMQWKRAAPLLEEQRERDIRASNTVRAMDNLGSMFDMAIREMPPRTGSGLVELQHWLRRRAPADQVRP